ncbi:MAG: UDP-4-amino-4,6-dideoxy-N-acetyl-beta-L-altrosamine transaminase [Paenibacillaceae bacterium]
MDKLAIHGGPPVRKSMLPYGKQSIDDDDIAKVVHILKSDYLTQGPAITEFEQAVASRAGASYAVAFCNGTAALHGACFAAGIGVGDEVITSALTFAASSNCVLYQGGTPVFADVHQDTFLLDIEDVQRKLTKRTKAIIPVDFAGQPVDMKAFKAFAEVNNLVMIQDAAHSFGASYAGDNAGSIADMTMFSFHPVKPVTTGEGGVIVTNNELYYQKLLLFRSHGITRDSSQLLHDSEGPWYYEMQELGYNYRMTDIQAALGTSQLKKLDRYVTSRSKLADTYHQHLTQIEEDGLLIRPYVDSLASSGWHLYVIQLNLERLRVGRREVFEALRAENIGVNVHYQPVYLMPYYQKLGFSRGLCPHSESLYKSFITLPLFPSMQEQDAMDTIDAVNKVVRFYAK